MESSIAGHCGRAPIESDTHMHIVSLQAHNTAFIACLVHLVKVEKDGHLRWGVNKARADPDF